MLFILKYTVGEDEIYSTEIETDTLMNAINRADLHDAPYGDGRRSLYSQEAGELNFLVSWQGIWNSGHIVMEN